MNSENSNANGLSLRHIDLDEKCLVDSKIFQPGLNMNEFEMISKQLRTVEELVHGSMDFIYTKTEHQKDNVTYKDLYSIMSFLSKVQPVLNRIEDICEQKMLETYDQNNFLPAD